MRLPELEPKRFRAAAVQPQPNPIAGFHAHGKSGSTRKPIRQPTRQPVRQPIRPVGTKWFRTIEPIESIQSVRPVFPVGTIRPFRIAFGSGFAIRQRQPGIAKRTRTKQWPIGQFRQYAGTKRTTRQHERDEWNERHERSGHEQPTRHGKRPNDGRKHGSSNDTILAGSGPYRGRSNDREVRPTERRIAGDDQMGTRRSMAPHRSDARANAAFLPDAASGRA